MTCGKTFTHLQTHSTGIDFFSFFKNPVRFNHTGETINAEMTTPIEMPSNELTTFSGTETYWLLIR